MTGKIIFLNGVSSSGKTSISNELLKLLDKNWVYMSVDDWLKNHKQKNGFDKSISKFHKKIQSVSNLGNNLIIDHVLEKESEYKEVISLLRDIPMVFIHVWCSPQILDAREKKRDDRKLGLAKMQFDQVYKYPCDLMIDTTNSTPFKSAKLIYKNLNKLFLE